MLLYYLLIPHHCVGAFKYFQCSHVLYTYTSQCMVLILFTCLYYIYKCVLLPIHVFRECPELPVSLPCSKPSFEYSAVQTCSPRAVWPLAATCVVWAELPCKHQTLLITWFCCCMCMHYIHLDYSTVMISFMCLCYMYNDDHCAALQECLELPVSLPSILQAHMYSWGVLCSPDLFSQSCTWRLAATRVVWAELPHVRWQAPPHISKSSHTWIATHHTRQGHIYIYVQWISTYLYTTLAIITIITVTCTHLLDQPHYKWST